MKLFILLIFISLFSCSYPDIDSVPEFDSVKITFHDSLTICNFNNKFKESEFEINKRFFEINSYSSETNNLISSRILVKHDFKDIGKEDCLKEVKYLIKRL